MAAEGRQEGLCDLSNVLAARPQRTVASEGRKVATKLAKISPIGNTAEATGAAATTSTFPGSPRGTTTQLLPHAPPGQNTATIPDHTTHV